MKHTPTIKSNIRATTTTITTTSQSNQAAAAASPPPPQIFPPSRHLEAGGLNTLLDTKWDIALFAVAIFFAFNLTVVLFWWWFRRRRQGRVIHVEEEAKQQETSPQKKLEDTKKPSKATNNNKNRAITILPVISFAAKSHLDSSSEDGEGGDERSIVSSMYDTTSQKWDESYFNTSTGFGNGNGTGVMKETIDGILGSRFFPYNAPTTPKIPTTSTTQRKKDSQYDGGGKISGTSGDTSTTHQESNTGISFDYPASTQSFEI